MNVSGKNKLIQNVYKHIGEIKKYYKDSSNTQRNSKKLIADLNKLEKEIAQLTNELNHTENLKEFDTNNSGQTAQLKEKLDVYKANLHSQIENAPDSMWSVNKNLKIITINNKFKNEFKSAFGVELFEGLDIIKPLPEPLSSIWKDRYLKALSGENYSILDVFDIEGIPSYIETSFNPIKYNNDIIGVTCIGKNITTQKLNEEKLNKIFENSQSSISIQTENEILLANKEWERITGYTQSELKSLKPMDLVHPESKDKISKIVKDRFNGNKAPTKYTFHLISKDGAEKWVNIGVTMIDYLGTKASLVVGNDVTELYNLQEAIRTNEANLYSLIENTDARIWSVDKNLDIVSINSNFKNDFKLAFNVELNKGVNALSGIDKDLSEVWKKRYLRALRGDKFLATDQFRIELLPQWIETSFNPIVIDDNVVGVSCFSRDISTQKISEEALKESEERLKTLITNIPSVSYRCVLDESWTMEFISDEVQTLSGYPPSDFIQNKVRSFASIIHPEDRGLIYNSVLESIKDKTYYNINYRIIDINGIIHWVSERGKAEYNKNGDVLWLYGVISDITQQKNTEEALAESEMRYRAIFNTMTDIYIRIDMDGYIQIITPSVVDVLGYKPGEIIGKPFSDIYSIKENSENLIEILLSKNSIRDFEVRLISKNNEIKTIALNASIVKNEKGENIAIEGIARDITLRKIAEQSLQERTNELNTIFDNAPMLLLLVNEEGKVLNINRAATRYSNKGSSELINNLGGEVLKCINSYPKSEGCGKFPSCDACVIRNTLKKTFKTRNNQNKVEGSLILNINGTDTIKYFLISTIYIDTENTSRVLISLDDITDIKEAQEEIRKLSAAVDQSMATIVITDKNGAITYANPQFERSTGYTIKEVLGKNPSILKSSKASSVDYKKLWDTILAGHTWQGEFLNKRKDGVEYWERAIISPIFNDNVEIDSFIAVKEDITHHKKIQEELIKSEKELRQINTERSKFISILAHDLRGLVGSYHAYSDLIFSQINSFTTEQLKEQIENLAKSSGESLALLDNLLEWGKVSQGNIIKLPKELSLKNEISSLIKILSEFSSSKGIELCNTSTTDINLFADPNILQTILRNLVYNAIKFTPKDGRISIYYARNSSDSVEISVEDTGIGISKAIMDKLFNTGEKVVREGTNSESGSGLGLLICEEMVKQLGGRIEVESTVGKGSRFFFKIPLKMPL